LLAVAAAVATASVTAVEAAAAAAAETTRVDRAHRVCLCCGSSGVGDERHVIFECAALASLRSSTVEVQIYQTC